MAIILNFGCSTLTKVNHEVDMAITQYDATKDLYIYIRDYVIKNRTDLNIPEEFWSKLITADTKLKDLDELILRIKLLKSITKNEVEIIKTQVDLFNEILDK